LDPIGTLIIYEVGEW